MDLGWAVWVVLGIIASIHFIRNLFSTYLEITAADILVAILILVMGGMLGGVAFAAVLFTLAVEKLSTTVVYRRIKQK